jgi:cytochrome c peroxidase
MADPGWLARTTARFDSVFTSRLGATLIASGCALGGLSCELAAPVVEAQEAAPKMGAHGALAMDEQQKLLDRLKLTGGPPAGVHPLVWQMMVPEDNALEPARMALGRRLYFDTRLSKDGTVSCATCHDVSKGFTDRRPLSEGIGGKVGRRNAPTTANALLLQTQFWDGRADSLEAQAMLPITNPIEMGMPDGNAAVAAIAGDQSYQAEFQKAYGRPVNFDDIARAIASFERTLVFLDAPYDRFAAGDVKALTDDEKRGMALFFGKARCVSCHQLNGSNPLGTNNKFHNIGVSARHQDFEALAVRALKALEETGDSREAQDRLALETDLSELGRFVVTKNRADIGGFRTSQVRNVGVTAPYMHDGSLQTLWDVVDHYNKGGESNPYLDGGIEPLALSEGEVFDLVSFLFALTDSRLAEDNLAEFQRQRGLAEKKRPFRDDGLAQRKTFPFEARLGASK